MRKNLIKYLSKHPYKVSRHFGNKNFALIGFMGCGKTTIGRALSYKLNRRLIDCDAEIEKIAGMNTNAIFESYGEAYFRRLEQEFIESLNTDAVQNAIISTGGGVVKNKINIDNLRKNCIIIYLKVSPQKIHRNLLYNSSRPLLNVPDKLLRITELLNEREPLYISSAHIIIDCDLLTPAQTVTKIIKRVCGKMPLKMKIEEDFFE